MRDLIKIGVVIKGFAVRRTWNGPTFLMMIMPTRRVVRGDDAKKNRPRANVTQVLTERNVLLCRVAKSNSGGSTLVRVDGSTTKGARTGFVHRFSCRWREDTKGRSFLFVALNWDPSLPFSISARGHRIFWYIRVWREKQHHVRLFI